MIRVALAVIGLVSTCFYVVINHSEVNAFYVCNGEIRRGGTASSETACMQLTIYRPWVHLWGDHDGGFTIQLDHQALNSYSPFDQIGDGSLALYQIVDVVDGKFRGGFRAANGELTFAFTDKYVFVGRCRPSQLGLPRA